MSVRTILCALGCLASAGCLEATNEVSWKADGSGTIRQRFDVDLAKAEELRTLAVAILGAGKEPEVEIDPLAASWFRTAAKGREGYEISKIADETKEPRRSVTVDAAFTNLEAAAKAGAFFTSAVALEKTPDGPWVLRMTDRLSVAKAKADEKSASSGMDYGAILGVFEPQLSGLVFRRTLTFPAPVKETNGRKSEDGRTVTWSVDFEKLRDGGDLELTVKFDAPGGSGWKPFTHQPDWKALRRRFTEAPPPEPAADAPATEPPAAPGAPR